MSADVSPRDEMDALLDPLVTFAQQMLAKRGEFCVDALIRPADAEPTDAIEVRIEHRDADPVCVQMPYKKRRLRGIAYGRHWVSPGTARIFT